MDENIRNYSNNEQQITPITPEEELTVRKYVNPQFFDVEAIIDYLNNNGEKLGLINVHLYRPFSSKYFLKELPKTVKKIAEENKVAIRNIRRDVIDGLKKLEKDSLISEDALRQHSDEVQKLTDKFIAEIDKTAKDKEQSIMSI